MSRVPRLEGWPLWCAVCLQTVRCKGDTGCTHKPDCTSYWRRVAHKQEMERQAAEAARPVDVEYERHVWPPRARREPKE